MEYTVSTIRISSIIIGMEILNNSTNFYKLGYYR